MCFYPPWVKEVGFEVKGEVVTEDDRDRKNKLYPLTLFRKAPQKIMSNYVRSISYSPMPPILAEGEKEKKEETILQTELLPVIIADGDSIPSALLSKTYIKHGLSEVERYHAKCGDIGIKYLKRAFPLLKVPKQYRCEYCIEGKIHKFGHGACKEGERTNYLPGVCIHTDHSGPYARSIGGARYSQIFMDRGSGYIWGFRMAKKTGHYLVAPQVFIDSKALSGRSVQIFYSDGDGVFSSRETKEILDREKIRQEFSAPYDSDTNPFIERARRTIFEGVCTALIRCGAPAGFWGEAEAHKIFSMNNLPVVSDPENEGKFISRRNILTGTRRPYNLEKLMAFGLLAIFLWSDEKGERDPTRDEVLKVHFWGMWKICQLIEFGTWRVKLFVRFHLILLFAMKVITLSEIKVFGPPKVLTTHIPSHRLLMALCPRSSGKNLILMERRRARCLMWPPD